ncbi:hypothetical protein BD779DRAFT_189637 [Infundibulicybe gibba]|nr:hypothetical protein BD779DRAFT_189637 [Infundibulicybe gibba]
MVVPPPPQGRLGNSPEYTLRRLTHTIRILRAELARPRMSVKRASASLIAFCKSTAADDRLIPRIPSDAVASYEPRRKSSVPALHAKLTPGDVQAQGEEDPYASRGCISRCIIA